eukprot:15230883-Alexandrium_andersonii.AAC.1
MPRPRFQRWTSVPPPTGVAHAPAAHEPRNRPDVGVPAGRGGVPRRRGPGSKPVERAAGSAE